MKHTLSEKINAKSSVAKCSCGECTNKNVTLLFRSIELASEKSSLLKTYYIFY